MRTNGILTDVTDCRRVVSDINYDKILAFSVLLFFLIDGFFLVIAVSSNPAIAADPGVPPSPAQFPKPACVVSAPPMWGYDHVPQVYQTTGAISGRVTVANTTIGVPHAYVAIVNACNYSEAFYVGEADANGFYQFAFVNNTYDGSTYQPRYKAYANHSLFGQGFSNRFPVEMSSTAPANVVIYYNPVATPTPTPLPAVLHYPSKDIQVMPAPAMASSQQTGAVAGRITTPDTSVGVPNADVLIVSSSNVTQAYYIGKSDPSGYFQFIGVNSTYNTATSTYDSSYKIYAFNSLYGESYSNSFSVEPYSSAQANVVMLPIPARIQLATEKDTIVADGSDNLTVSAYVTDVLGKPVLSGTPVDFTINCGDSYDSTSMGHWSERTTQHFYGYTINGYANATFGWVPADTAENCVSISAASLAVVGDPVNDTSTIAITHDPASTPKPYANVVWTRTYSGSGYRKGESIAVVKDGYVIAGTTHSNDTLDDVSLTKVDANGTVVWDRTFKESNYQFGSCVIAVHDGFVVTGQTDNEDGFSDAYLLKTDLDGNEVWRKVYGGASSDSGSEVVAAGDGYVITGLTFSRGNGSSDVYLLKTDLNGNIAWEKTYGTPRWECGYSIAAVPDGYAIVGDTVTEGGDLDVYLLRTDKNGDLLWSKTYGGSDTDDGTSIVATGDGYVIAGVTVSYSDHSYASGSSDVYLLKTDLAGNKVWQKTYGGSNIDMGASIVAASDGYAIAGVTYTNDTNNFDTYLVKTDLNGDKVWQKACGGTNFESGHNVAAVSDGYLIAGTTESMSESLPSLYLVKINQTPAAATPCVATYNLTLYQGWNLISIPVELQDYSLSSIFPANVMDNVTSIWGWNESTQSWVFYSYDPDDDFYQYLPALTRLEPGKAYWVQMDQPGSLTVQGTVPGYAPGSTTVLGPDWNFVGTTGMSSPPITSVYPDAVSVWAWNGITQSWEIYCFDPDHFYYQVLPELTTAHPGKGYWVQME